eukprot:CAMPEP_0180070222 /NCGR_PEP_ID=MMETSP0985-20121206/11455_1 /TAXON_ID=483367 /ORGANISM="non described non described, Strain CCMP 2436" /LENGTH=190 /DNA_ID=CAMNT_0022001287 /DNA_START=476 /DNA_END=1048 /DNA_ORIENTATION=-
MTREASLSLPAIEGCIVPKPGPVVSSHARGSAHGVSLPAAANARANVPAALSSMMAMAQRARARMSATAAHCITEAALLHDFLRVVTGFNPHSVREQPRSNEWHTVRTVAARREEVTAKRTRGVRLLEHVQDAPAVAHAAQQRGRTDACLSSSMMRLEVHQPRVSAQRAFPECPGLVRVYEMLVHLGGQI